MRRLRLQSTDDFFQLGFGQHIHPAVVQPQPACTQSHLRAGFFACYIKRALAAALQTVQRLQQQGGFANARIAADQHHTAFDHAAAHYAIEFILTGRCAIHLLRFDVAERHHR